MRRIERASKTLAARLRQIVFPALATEARAALTQPLDKLTSQELEKALSELPGWKLENGSLVRDWKFKDFAEAMVFVNSVAEVAESAGHHPDIDIRYNQVRLGLVTHDAGGITANDTEMAGRLGREV